MPQHAEAKATTFRKPPLVIFAALGMGFLAIMCIVADWKLPPNGQAFALATIVSAIVYVIYLIGVNSAVRMDGNGITVDNFIVRHEIPWAELTEIGVRDGLYFHLNDGTYIKSTSYAGSLGAAMTDYRYTKRVAGRMQMIRDQMAVGNDGARASVAHSSRIRVSPWPPLTILAVLETVALLSQVLR